MPSARRDLQQPPDRQEHQGSTSTPHSGISWVLVRPGGQWRVAQLGRAAASKTAGSRFKPWRISRDTSTTRVSTSGEQRSLDKNQLQARRQQRNNHAQRWGCRLATKSVTQQVGHRPAKAAQARTQGTATRSQRAKGNRHTRLNTHLIVDQRT